MFSRQPCNYPDPAVPLTDSRTQHPDLAVLVADIRTNHPDLAFSSTDHHITTTELAVPLADRLTAPCTPEYGQEPEIKC